MAKKTLVERIESTSTVDLLLKIIFLFCIIGLASVISGAGKDATFGAMITVLGIIFAMYLVLEQMYQQSREFKRQALRNHVISASENVYSHQIYEGLIVSVKSNDKFIASWYVDFMDNQKYPHYNFHFFLTTLPKQNDYKKIKIKRFKWDYRVIVPRFGCNHGVIVEISSALRKSNYTITHMDDYSRRCVMTALKRIQLGDRKKLFRYWRQLHKSPLKTKNRKFVKKNIFAAKSVSRQY